MVEVNNTNIESITPILSPADLKAEIPLDKATGEQILRWRQEIAVSINKGGSKLLVIVGPCSIHDPVSALDYAKRLLAFREEFAKKLIIVMRVYFEKPRTTIGWKGLINDPGLDGSYDIARGLRTARRLLLQINQLGLPVGCEFLDVFTPQYFADLVSWGAIGARTTESQLHRELASGLSMPIGFKNGTDGSVDVAIDGIVCAESPHVFLGIDDKGAASIVKTKGNKCLHVILRGSSVATNYDHVSMANIHTLLHRRNISTRVLVDCSHGNSGKSYKNQPLVVEAVMNQIAVHGDINRIGGFMIESHIEAGAQKHQIQNGSIGLEYGKSITDECVSLEMTYAMLKRIILV